LGTTPFSSSFFLSSLHPLLELKDSKKERTKKKKDLSKCGDSSENQGSHEYHDHIYIASRLDFDA
jgi:hypothetical protein